MIIGLGNDLVDIRRIEKSLETFGERFIRRCFAIEEIERAERKRAAGLHIASYAKRFAAKEAGVEIVTGDTKVVERGKGDGIFINTAGIDVSHISHRKTKT